MGMPVDGLVRVRIIHTKPPDRASIARQEHCIILVPGVHFMIYSFSHLILD